MNRQIRKSTFETNSSSTHSLIICTNEEYKDLYAEKLYIDEDDEFVTGEAYRKLVIDLYIQEKGKPEVLDYEKFFEEFYEELDEFADEYKWDLPRTLERWIGNLEECIIHHTTKSGDEIVVVAKYGYDS